MTSSKHNKTSKPSDLDLTDDPGIKRSRGIQSPPPAAAEGRINNVLGRSYEAYVKGAARGIRQERFAPVRRKAWLTTDKPSLATRRPPVTQKPRLSSLEDHIRVERRDQTFGLSPASLSEANFLVTRLE